MTSLFPCPVLPLRRSSWLLVLICLLPLTSCAASSLGESLQKSFAADPKLTAASPTASPTASQPLPSPSPTGTGKLSTIPDLPGDADVGTGEPLATPTSASQPTTTPATSQPTDFSDLGQAPQELRSAIAEVAQLGILTPAKTKASANDQFQPNKAITRREFAQWLVAANNQLNRDRPTRQLRLGAKDAQPAFQDVPRTDPDFAPIQGLAEAGILPSPLSGDSTTVTFRPDAPLTRETLVMWKVPLDSRQPLPTATIDAVKQTWGFQDATKIDPRALRSVLADFQNGDLANLRRVYGFTTLFQPKKAVSRAEAAAALWYFGYQGEGTSAKDALKPASQETQKEDKDAG